MHGDSEEASRQLSNAVLKAYVKAALDALSAEIVFPPPDSNRPRPSRWQRWQYRQRRRWERLTSYRLVSMEDYSNRWDY